MLGSRRQPERSAPARCRCTACRIIPERSATESSRRSLDIFASQAGQAFQRDDDRFGALIFRAPTDRQYMFDIPENWRHRIAQLVGGDRYERATRVERLRYAGDNTRVPG